jgi:4-hydroxy-2-oxoheptanedioate aldolase
MNERTIKMRPSRVLEKLRAGEMVSCIKMNLSDSRAFEIAAMSGVDCLWSDMEHVPNDWSAIEKQILAAKSRNVDIMCRVSRGGYSDYIKPFEMDCTGIMVPHIMSVEDARNIVRMTRFHPVGRRPLDGGNADGAYCNIDMMEYIKEANEQRFVVVQIEDPEALDDLEAIASLEGIDMLFFGPGDFSQGIGAPGQWDHPKIMETYKRVAEVANAHGKFAGVPGGPDEIDELYKMGYRFVSLGADVVALGQYCFDLVDRFNKNSPSKGEKKGIYGAK